ncbi:MAG TPA: pilus assembly PilX N-terminal domain-containing protein [Rhodocyclaceae bacterium]|nr:pilus assembly PilX N-terminal domain-containing protein [Rhodocyclaceae bacterium]
MLRFPASHRGVALVVGLIMLTVLTLLVVSAIKIGVLELKIGGVSYLAAQNFANAELAIAEFLDGNAGTLQPGCVEADLSGPNKGTSCFFPAGAPSNVSISGGPGGYSATLALQNGTATVTASEIGCGADAGVGSGNQVPGAGILSWDAAAFDIRAKSEGSIAGVALVHQGVKKKLTAGGCGG